MRNIGTVGMKNSYSLSTKTLDMVTETRQLVASLFNVEDPYRVIFIPNCTIAINMVIYGVLSENDRVITSSLEHNSIMRPLGKLYIEKNIKIVETTHNHDLSVNLFDLHNKSLSAELVAITHGDNVTGNTNNIHDIVDISHKNGAYVMIDASHTAGLIEIDVDNSGIDFLVMSGHKNLFAPLGVGILILGKTINARDCKTIMQGTTGSFSEFEIEPDIIPDKFEIGSLNYPAIAGLNASIKWLLDSGLNAIYYKTELIRNKLIDSVRKFKNVTIYSTVVDTPTNIFSFNIKGLDAYTLSDILDKKYNIMTNASLHCNPKAHKYLGTYPAGSVRVSPNIFTSQDNIDYFISSVKEIHNKSK